jgi:hypothetical protein
MMFEKKKALQWYSQRYCLPSVTKTFTLSPSATVCLVLRKRLHYPLFKVQSVERWIVCTPLSVNVFVTLTTQ